MPKKLPQYKGPLTPAQTADGINAALRNAQRLADAASLLFKHEEYPLAASIAALSIEEVGKIRILRSLAVARSEQEVKQHWKAYRSHTTKNVIWPILQMVAGGANHPDEFKTLFNKESEHPDFLDHAKQLGFYTDCLGTGHWSCPEAVIDRKLAAELILSAGFLAKTIKPVTQTEIELWVKHMGPVWKGPNELVEHALVQFYKEMQEKGLAEPGDNLMENFILDGLDFGFD